MSFDHDLREAERRYSVEATPGNLFRLRRARCNAGQCCAHRHDVPAPPAATSPPHVEGARLRRLAISMREVEVVGSFVRPAEFPGRLDEDGLVEALRRVGRVPRDARPHTTWHDACSNVVVVAIESDEFDLVAPGDEIPLLFPDEESRTYRARPGEAPHAFYCLPSWLGQVLGLDEA